MTRPTDASDPASRRRRVYITPSATARARERYAELLGLTDDEIGQLLDEAATSALATPAQVSKVLDYGQPALVVDISGGRFGRGTVALLKANRDASDPPLVLVALLGRESAEASKRDGRWTVVERDPALDLLIERTLSAPAAAASVPSVRARPPQAAAAPARVELGGLTPTPGPATTRLISYVAATTPPETKYEEVTAAEIAARVMALMGSPEVVRDSVRVWKRVAFEVRVVVDDDGEG